MRYHRSARRAEARREERQRKQLHCAGLDLGGAGWRLPTIQELQTIVDETQNGAALDGTAFPSQPDGDYWASTPCDVGTFAWKVDFHDGSINPYDVNALCSARRVP